MLAASPSVRDSLFNPQLPEQGRAFGKRLRGPRLRPTAHHFGVSLSDSRHSRPKKLSAWCEVSARIGLLSWMETAMKNTTQIELSLEELDLISGGEGFSTVSHTGSIVIGTGSKGSYVSWPGQVDGVNGTWTMSTKSGLNWHPA